MKYILAIFLFVAITQSFTTGGINKVVLSLADYQLPHSGFSFDGEVATIEATSQAIFLSSFFGQRDKIDVPGISEFLRNSNNGDGGYGNRAGGKSELSSTRYALLTLNHLGLITPNELKTYILSLYNKDKAMFSNTYGGAADLKSTAIALQSLDQLNALQKVATDDIKRNLRNLKAESGGVKYFSTDLVENYYGIVVGSLVNFDFGDVLPWANFFLEKQIKQGDLEGAFLNGDVTSSHITECSVSAIDILDDLTDLDLVSKIDTEDLLKYIDSLPKDLSAAADGYKTLARANLIEEIFHTRVVYESLQDIYTTITDRITEGNQIKPKISVRTPSGLAHAGLDVSVHITNSNGDTKTIKLPWDVESQYYAGIEFYSANTLGSVTFKFDVKWVVADLGSDVQYSVSQEKTVGYKVRVFSNAQLAGKDIEEGGDIGIGTEFKFRLALETAKKKNLLNGDFIVDFLVKDSSSEVIHSEPLDCTNNNAEIRFSYVLEKLNIPSGLVVFSFGVRGKDNPQHHTVFEVSYLLVMKMIATEIKFPGNKFKVGEDLVVSMTPASFPDLSTVIPLSSSKDSKRKFHLDVLSADTVVKSVEGVAQIQKDGNLKYTFKLKVDSTFDALGKHTVQFRYVPHYGEPSYLENYDSEKEELFSELEELTYNVESKSQIVDFGGSFKSELRYGNSVKLTFRVQDTISGNYIYPVSSEYNVFLRLKHRDENGAVFIGASQPASIVYKNGAPDHFFFDWNINPNVVKGKGELELVVQTPNGAVPLLGSDNREWRKDVTIGGDVIVTAETKSGEIDEKKTVFTLQFSLSCDGVKLSDANLVAVVSKNGKKVEVAPVALGVGNGDYEISWILDNKHTESGDYNVKFYRQVDVSRSDNFNNIEAFFSTSLTHDKKVQERGIVPTQFLVLLLLLAAFGFTSWRKMKIEAPNRK